MKSVGLVLLLIAAFAYSGVEGANACETALKSKWTLYNGIRGNSVPISVVDACLLDPAGRAALVAGQGYSGCQGYNYYEGGDIKCDVLFAPFWKCIAAKLGYLKTNGSIEQKKILAQFKADATSDPKCSVAQYNFAVKKCGTTIKNYNFLKKVQGIATATDQFTAG
ncbi:uncharacterized protein LOC108666796 [Hyalella azteca]|uniref:Uncharacterized protein LOC108666796 n=1 Tax=Hyalella azteca TaxID=294128 RepID=A0A8B7N7F9_HYAAZ|nr:uncharacterized protein LOC108666796 [Hyalella azteca]XP_018009211.1 uncharacterized protein LOC108666796 [Hyalella azteca]XP_018009213.1 uncharacterized protein LOC108666796 [Hyalella azteca]XP_047739683.1 uncharacterized protein LOC108666796 [Hyalella azteca]XP_047739684.1 uncharacterized protein LOC108666796 [Hyalella azteca]XP_047739685.1 uncharacterized protein LOC108666796 [Hyalella azteca]